MQAAGVIQFKGGARWGRSRPANGKPALQLSGSVRWPRTALSWHRYSPTAAAAPGSSNTPDLDSFRARLSGIRQASSDPSAAPGPDSEQQSGGLRQLRSSSENLKLLLERRAQRQQQQQASWKPAEADEAAPRGGALVPAPGGALAGMRGGGGEMEGVGGQRRMCKVRFWLKYRAEWGQRLKVVGTHECLGAWTLSSAPELKWSDGDMWHTTVELPAGSILEYKYVLLDNTGQLAVAWQRGNNSVLAVRHSDDFVEVFDNWGGDPGAKVVSDGEAPTTREGRLLSWASEVEAQMAAQRADQRRARMELVSAQEDAKLARSDAMRYRAQLAQSEQEKLAAVARARDLEVTNQVLHAQLDDVTRSFRAALETAAELLQHTDNAIDVAAAAAGVEGQKAARQQQQQQQPPAAPAKASPPAGSAAASAAGGPAPSAAAIQPPSRTGTAGTAPGANGVPPPAKRSRGRPRRVSPLPESGVGVEGAAPVAVKPRRNRVVKKNRPEAGPPAAPAPAPPVPHPPLGVIRGESKGSGVAAAPSARSLPRARRAVKMAAVPVVGGGTDVGLGGGPSPPRGWRGGQRWKLSRDLSRGGDPAAADLEPPAEGN